MSDKIAKTHMILKKQTPFNVFVDDNRGMVGYGLTYGENSYNGRPTSQGGPVVGVKIHAPKKDFLTTHFKAIKVPAQLECQRDPSTGKFIMRNLIVEGYTCPACKQTGHDVIIKTVVPRHRVEGTILLGSTGTKIPVYVAPRAVTKDDVGFVNEFDFSDKAASRRKHKHAK